MSVYPHSIDSDIDIVRIDDNLTEQGAETINQLREAVFSVEEELGILPSGSVTTVSARLDQSLNPDGTIKSSALTSIGLVTLPIENYHVGAGAGIVESKLTLDYSTSDLYALISNNTTLINALNIFTNGISADLNAHIGGSTVLPSDGTTLARHVGSHIDLNATPSDTRDPLYVWSGLKDKDGTDRTATTVAEALDQINTDLIGHENATSDGHTAAAISVDTDNFLELPTSATDVQKALDAVDSFETASIGDHRATQHANCIPPIARSYAIGMPDGYYGQNVVPPTPCSTYLAQPIGSTPRDNNADGDDIVAFFPDNTGFVFDSQFSQVKPGDIITINYGNNIQATYPIDSTLFTPGSVWRVRLNGYNLYDAPVAYARIDKPRYDADTAGVLAIASANATPTGSFNLLTGVIVGNPRGAVALGLGFDQNQLDATHYKLYIELYPTGNPEDEILSLPFIDVTGNAGITPGQYTLSSIVQATNNNFRQTGYNYRLIAFDHHGQFGIMLADCIGNASFAIIAGENNGGVISTGPYTENVVGGSVVDGFDAFGFGDTHANIAGPSYKSSFADSTAALLPTKVIVPRKNRNYIANGRKWDQFAATYMANNSGYWDGYIHSTFNTGTSIEVTYSVYLDLQAAELKPGKTIVIQPAISNTDPLYNSVDYGRFIIKEINYLPCPGSPFETQITVINGIHATGSPLSVSGSSPLQVRLYFSEDSVGFNYSQISSGGGAVVDKKRFYEILITDLGNTFGHERARFDLQVAGSYALATTDWHIRSVSPKLRGYKDIFTDIAKYVRFYIVSYDWVTGEFDGYIGRRNPLNNNIDNTGALVRGRKNVLTRFYDETNVDFIDLLFNETGVTATPILDIMTGNPRYVDFEVFPSLQTDDEFFTIATCEVNWNPATGQNVVEEVIDTRQFGSISADDFTESALDYISAGDRHLHENGIIRGLTFDYINSLDNREIFFKGGVALVNGYVISVNNISVTIPQIATGTWPATVNWAVCINESAELVPIIITATKEQYFANSSSGGTLYYVPSVTFSELVNTRKDLTPIAIVTAAIASVTITDSAVKDIRRLVASEGAMAPLTVASTTLGTIGNFYTFESVIEWIRAYATRDAVQPVGQIIVKIKGNIAVTSSIDLVTSLSALDCGIIFEGDDATITVTCTQGFLVGGNSNRITFRNINFIYSPAGIFIMPVGDKIGLGNGCIFKDPAINLQDLKIENCRFYAETTLSTRRPPFICLKVDNAKYIDGVTIRDCVFADEEAAYGIYAAVAIYGTCATGSATSPGTVTNVLVENNICNYYQGIYVTAAKTGSTFISPGLFANNVRIIGNKCGAIGYFISSYDTALTVRGYATSSGLLISGNTCRIIASTDYYGDVIRASSSATSNYVYGTGNVSIENNWCSWIHVVANDYTGQSPASLSIIGNNLKAGDETLVLRPIYWKSAAYTVNRAIFVYSRVSSKDISACIISNNMIIEDAILSFTYYNGIFCSVSAVITNNIINGFATGDGILIYSAVSLPIRKWNITENQFYRNTNTITSYIEGVVSSGLPDTPTNGQAIITDNYFDSYLCDGAADEDVVKNKQMGWIVERNKNQTETVGIRGSTGTVSVAEFIAGDTVITSGVKTFGSNGLSFTYKAADDAIVFGWETDLLGFLPTNVSFVYVAVTLITSTSIDTSAATLSVINYTDTLSESDGPHVLVASTPLLLELSPTIFYNGFGQAQTYIRLNLSVHHSGNCAVLTSGGITVKYRW